ncbi:unnamed protein product [Merluccius merluccius]
MRLGESQARGDHLPSGLACISPAAKCFGLEADRNVTPKSPSLIKKKRSLSTVDAHESNTDLAPHLIFGLFLVTPTTSTVLPMDQTCSTGVSMVTTL